MRVRFSPSADGYVVMKAACSGFNRAGESDLVVRWPHTRHMDHVHLFVTAPPKLSPSLIVQYLKGITGRKLLEKYPELRKQLWKGELWNHSTYIETIGDVSSETIRKYIEHQFKQY